MTNPKRNGQTGLRGAASPAFALFLLAALCACGTEPILYAGAADGAADDAAVDEWGEAPEDPADETTDETELGDRELDAPVDDFEPDVSEDGFGEPAGFGDAEADVAEDVEAKSIGEMNLRELQQMQAFVYAVRGGKDPFVFRQTQEDDEELGAPTWDTPGAGGSTAREEVVQPRDDGGIDPKQQAGYLAGAFERAKQKFLEGEHKQAFEICEEAGNEVFKWTEVTDEARPINQRLLALRMTVRRLANKQDILREFDELELEVKAIYVTRDGTWAIINDEVFEPGMRVRIGERTVLVDSVDEDGVVFDYKGQKIRRQVGVNLLNTPAD